MVKYGSSQLVLRKSDEGVEHILVMKISFVSSHL